jgi:hypothetical protein
VGKRWVAALATVVLLTGLVAGCGDDDEDDVASDDTEQVSEAAEHDAEAEEIKAAFCRDLESDSGDETPVEDVEAEIGRAVAAQTSTETQEQFDALQLLVDYGGYVVDTDDGDGVIDGEEASAGIEEFPTLEDAFAVLTDWCGSGDRYSGASGG